MTTGRRGQRVLALGALVVGLLAVRAAGAFLAPLPSARPAAATGPVAPTTALPLRGPAAVDLLLGAEDGLLRVDLDRRAVAAVSPPGEPPGLDGGLVRRDRTVVAVRGEVAYVASGRPARPAVRLGPASYALASAAARRVWLVEQGGDPGHWYRVREVALDPPEGPGRAGPSARVVARGTLPLGRRPVAGVPGGLLVDVAGPGGGLAVWDPRTGRTGHRLATGSPPLVVAASGRTVAWVEGSILHLGDLASGRDRVVPPPAGSDGFSRAGAFSPDGRTLAAVTRVGFSTRPALALVEVARGSATRVAGSEGALSDRCSPCLAWAPGGDWVFFSRLGPGFGIGAYRLDQPRAATLALDLPGSLPPSFAVLHGG